MHLSRVYMSIQSILAGRSAATLQSHKLSGRNKDQHGASQGNFKHSWAEWGTDCLSSPGESLLAPWFVLLNN